MSRSLEEEVVTGLERSCADGAAIARVAVAPGSGTHCGVIRIEARFEGHGSMATITDGMAFRWSAELDAP